MPLRTCLGCRKTAQKSGLLRLAETDGRVVADPGGVLPGRGAYVCRLGSCLTEALKRKDGFSKAFRKKVVFEAAALERQVRDILDNTADGRKRI